MTSGKFRTIPISSITILRDERQRRELTDIDELAESIHRIGLIAPIVVTEDHVLVAGERRLTAAKALGWTSISVHYTSDLSELELQMIELEENVKRKALPWQDEVMAVERFDKLKRQMDESWTQEKTAKALGIPQSEIARRLTVAKEIIGGNTRVAEAEKLSTAVNLTTRVNERKRTSALDAVASTMFKEDAPEAPKRKPVPLIHADFHEWAAAYTERPFNLIHCDFPYGINVADAPRMSASIQEHYDDSPDVYWALLDTLEMAMSNVVADSAHLIFWFSMDYYEETRLRLEKMGWKVNRFPLIWHKGDGAGIAPDPQRLPRRTYETAFFAARGDRKLTQVGTQPNSFSHPGRRGPDGIHLSEKPVPMLQHFMRMVCDEYSNVLDPTAGSGNALKAATACGAATVLGIEKSLDFYTTSVMRYYGAEDAE